MSLKYCHLMHYLVKRDKYCHGFIPVSVWKVVKCALLFVHTQHLALGLYSVGWWKAFWEAWKPFTVAEMDGTGFGNEGTSNMFFSHSVACASDGTDTLRYFLINPAVCTGCVTNCSRISRISPHWPDFYGINHSQMLENKNTGKTKTLLGPRIVSMFFIPATIFIMSTKQPV